MRRPLLVECLLLVASIVAGLPLSAGAQTAQPRLAVAVGPDWISTADVGGANATLTGASGGRFNLFDTTTTLTGGVGVSGAFGIRIAGGLWAELTGRYHSARLASRVTGDVEAADETATETLQQMQIDGGLLWLPERLLVGSRLQAFLSGGAGYLRQLHNTNTLAEAGQSFYAGSGMIVALPERQGGMFKGSGVRLDVRASMTRRGVAFDDRVHAAPALWASLFLRF